MKIRWKEDAQSGDKEGERETDDCIRKAVVAVAGQRESKPCGGFI